MTEPNTMHVAFSHLGTIRKWSTEPFVGSVAYTRPDLADTYLCTVLADIRTVTGVGDKPMLSELAAAIGERMQSLKSPEWFYPEGYDECCSFDVQEVIDGYDLGIGHHVVAVDCAKPLPTIWCAVHVLSEDEQEIMGTDDAYIACEYTTEAEALASIPAAPEGEGL